MLSFSVFVTLEHVDYFTNFRILKSRFLGSFVSAITLTALVTIARFAQSMESATVASAYALQAGPVGTASDLIFYLYASLCFLEQRMEWFGGGGGGNKKMGKLEEPLAICVF